MADYSRLSEPLLELKVEKDGDWKSIVERLIDVWLYDYEVFGSLHGSVWTTVDRFDYLFNVIDARLIAAWGVSGGRVDDPRDDRRQKGTPKGGGAAYHRGHAIPHRLGGGLDINVVPQLGRVNSGAFQNLEKQARETPDALYFTYWSYKLTDLRPGPKSQRPSRVDQGLLIPGQPPEIARHIN